ncbi:MAG: copper resistance protein CopC [Solirubrobacteraceae bacterium]
MSRPGRIVVALAAVLIGLVLPSATSAHAYLVRTVPVASGVLNGPPRNVALTYDEAVEPRFAIISVTDVNGRQETTGPVQRSAANPDTLIVPLRPRLPEGWYLIYWRAISVDGHPVQGAFTYAVGPNPGPAPQFVVPSISQSATSPNLLVARWVMFLSVMIAIGLFAFRFAIARPLARRVSQASLRAVSIAFVVASVIGALAIPVYLDFATAGDSLHSVFDVAVLVPLFRVTAFGRGYVAMVLCFALFCAAGWISLYLDRPDREHRSLAEIGSQTGAALAAAAVLVIPGAVGHAGQTSPPRRLGAGRLAAPDLRIAVAGRPGRAADPVGGGRRPAARTDAVCGRAPLLLDALWDTGYGVAILVKIGILLVAMAVAAGNLLRTRPRLVAAGADASLGPPAASLLRRLVAGETVLVTGAVFVAALLSSLAPPPPAFALQDKAIASVGPGRVVQTVQRNGYLLQVLVSPNKAAAPDSFALRITKGGQPVRHANVTLTVNHLEMQMPQQEYQLTETQPGIYSRRAPALIMVGRWGLAYNVTPPGGQPFTALIVDQADG